jgi:hypothetical protein|nr:MAG TPA: protein of unknown function (DUF5604) [Caudoviricetes sp.]DAZ54177.1 MAG TPA: protein of unknown function (DUF5604) [Caudoviricetes sp.]
MIVKAMYYKPQMNGYGGRSYTFRTDLPLKAGDKVLAPGGEGDPKKAIITEVDLPESVIDVRWADRVKYITQYDAEVTA